MDPTLNKLDKIIVLLEEIRNREINRTLDNISGYLWGTSSMDKQAYKEAQQKINEAYDRYVRSMMT